jgi:hypothetical protein
MAYTYDEDGSETESIEQRQKKKRNPVLDPMEDLLTKPENQAPASKFIKRQKRLDQLIKDM